jgi:tetratricopeptide (TPR) repeat protein
MPDRTRRFAYGVLGKTILKRQVLPSCTAVSVALTVAALLALPMSARAQEATTPDERRCTGQWRATSNERIASCTALIDSGRYQPANLAILHHDRGVAARAKGDLGGALSDFAEAIGLNPDYARAFADRGSVRLAQHDLDGAIADLDTAIRLDGNDAGAFMTRGNAFDEKMDFDRAIADYNDAIRLSPNYAAAYFNRGLAFRRKGDFDHAIADYDQAIRLDPKNVSALNNRGIVWFEKGDLDRAIADYNQALRRRQFRAGLQ